MYKLMRGFSTAIKKPRMELTIRTPYQTFFSNYTDFRLILTKTTDASLTIMNFMPAAVHMLPPGFISVKPLIEDKNFIGEFVHMGGWAVVHADNTCEINLFEAYDRSQFKYVKNDKLKPPTSSNEVAIKFIEFIRTTTERTFFKG